MAYHPQSCQEILTIHIFLLKNTHFSIKRKYGQPTMQGKASENHSPCLEISRKLHPHGETLHKHFITSLPSETKLKNYLKRTLSIIFIVSI